MYFLGGEHVCAWPWNSAQRQSGVAGGSAKERYRAWLGARQRAATLGGGDGVRWVDDVALERELLEPFIEPNAPNDVLDPITPTVVDDAVQRRDAARIGWQMSAAQDAIGSMRAVQPRWVAWFERYVNVVFAADVSANLGGSTGHAIGVIWMNVAPPVTTSDLVEFFAHEMTHQVLFVDDRLHGHYTPPVYAQQTGFVRSAIRGSERPLPCAFDSLMVAMELLRLRRTVLGEPDKPRFHPRSDELLTGCWETVQSIVSSPGWETWLSGRGRYLLDVAVNSLAGMSVPQRIPARALPALTV